MILHIQSAYVLCLLNARSRALAVLYCPPPPFDVVAFALSSMFRIVYVCILVHTHIECALYLNSYGKLARNCRRRHRCCRLPFVVARQIFATDYCANYSIEIKLRALCSVGRSVGNLHTHSVRRALVCAVLIGRCIGASLRCVCVWVSKHASALYYCRHTNTCAPDVFLWPHKWLPPTNTTSTISYSYPQHTHRATSTHKVLLCVCTNPKSTQYCSAYEHTTYTYSYCKHAVVTKPQKQQQHTHAHTMTRAEHFIHSYEDADTAARCRCRRRQLRRRCRRTRFIYPSP